MILTDQQDPVQQIHLNNYHIPLPSGNQFLG